ncbi:MAG: ABC transporter permease [Desulfurococcales archaeon]|nr:ABC transporter permease [Desulfurococcales archaeon]
MPLGELVVKEVKNTLRDKKIIITVVLMPLVIFAIMGFVYNYGFTQTVKEVAEKTKEARVLVCNLDSGNYSALVIKFIRSFAKEVHVIHVYDPGSVRNALQSGNFTFAVIIPAGFSQNVSKLQPSLVRIEAAVRGISMTSMASTSVISGFAQALNAYIRAYIAAQKGINPAFVTSPILPQLAVFFRGVEISPSALSALATSAMLLGFAPLIVVSTALGVASSSMAVENEEKTLEILLTLPIPRFKIVLSKLLGTLVLVVLATASYMAGFTIYMSFLFRGLGSTGELNGIPEPTSEVIPSGPASPINIFTLEPTLIVFIGVSTFLSLISVASLGILLGSIVPDVRTSQTYIGQLAILVIIPGLILSFMDLSSMSPSALAVMVAISPFISPVLVLKAQLEGMSWIPPIAVLWCLGFSGIMLYVTSKLINSERLLTLQFRILTRKMKKVSRA